MVRLKKVYHLVAVVLFLLFAHSSWPEVCKGSKVPKADLAHYDANALKRAVASELWPRN